MGDGHEGTSCPGYFRCSDTQVIQRCDDCAIFAGDDDAEDYLSQCGIELPLETE
jgi:hypothetical protein